MDLDKLRLDPFRTYGGFQIPDDFEVPLLEDPDPEVYFVFCTTFEDVARYTNMILNRQKHKNNRIFYIYKKGQKSFHHQHIYAYIDKSPFLKWKVPMLCKLDEQHTCLTAMIKC